MKKYKDYDHVKEEGYLSVTETKDYLKANRSQLKIGSTGLVFDFPRIWQNKYILIFGQFCNNNFRLYPQTYTLNVNGKNQEFFKKNHVDDLIAKHDSEIKEIKNSLTLRDFK